jgi:hypothetical protein
MDPFEALAEGTPRAAIDKTSRQAYHTSPMPTRAPTQPPTKMSQLRRPSVLIPAAQAGATAAEHAEEKGLVGPVVAIEAATAASSKALEEGGTEYEASTAADAETNMIESVLASRSAAVVQGSAQYVARPTTRAPTAQPTARASPSGVSRWQQELQKMELNPKAATKYLSRSQQELKQMQQEIVVEKAIAASISPAAAPKPKDSAIREEASNEP